MPAATPAAADADPRRSTPAGFSRAAFMFDTQPAAKGKPNATNTPNKKRPGRSAARNDSGTGRYADDAEPAETNAANTCLLYTSPSPRD